MTLGLLLAALPLAPTLTVTNLKNGDAYPCPVALVRGETTSPRVAVLNAEFDDEDGRNDVASFDGRYAVLIPLRSGNNRLTVMAGTASKRLTVRFDPPSTPYRVVPVYVTANDGDTRYASPRPDDDYDFRARIGTAALLMQVLTAERLNELGFGRKCFALDLDGRGRPLVRTLKLEQPASELRPRDGGDLWGFLYGILDKLYPFDRNKAMTVMAFTSYDGTTQKAQAHTALGGGGLGLFGGAATWSWPRNLREADDVFLDATVIDPTKALDDSAYRSTVWGLASTTMGAVLHEMGHTFGLPHVDDPNDLMSRGFDRFNRFFVAFEPNRKGRQDAKVHPLSDAAYWNPYYAAQLAAHPWFQPKGVAEAKGELTVKRENGVFRVASPSGLAFVGYETGDPVKRYKVEKLGKGDVVLDVAGMLRDLGEPEKVTLRVIDRAGRMQTVADIER